MAGFIVSFDIMHLGAHRGQDTTPLSQHWKKTLPGTEGKAEMDYDGPQ